VAVALQAFTFRGRKRNNPALFEKRHIAASNRGTRSCLPIFRASERRPAAAAQVGISEGHARQRLKAIFLKTGTSRQIELVALLAKLG
jgi:hypothetical protein